MLSLQLQTSRVKNRLYRNGVNGCRRRIGNHPSLLRGLHMSYTIKHMGLGGILDQAIAIIRDNFVLLFTIMLIVLIPVTLIQGFLLQAVTPDLPANATAQDYMNVQQAQAQYWPWFVGFGLLQFIIVIPIVNAAVIDAVARVYLGQPVTAMEAISYGVRRLLPLLGTTVLTTLAVSAGFLLFIIPGIYFSIWFALSQHVVVIEKLAGPTAMKRSKKLVHKDRGTLVALGIVLLVISFLANGATNYIPQPHLQVIGAAIVQALVTMLWTASMVVFYFSCRCNVENFDLHYLAQSIGPEPANSGQESMATSTI
jgi:hypothetical protein